MGLKKYGSAFALVVGFVLSACGGSGDGDKSGKACAWVQDGKTIECTEFIGGGFWEDYLDDYCGSQPVMKSCPKGENFVGICVYDSLSRYETHEYWYDWYREKADFAAMCEAYGGFWVKG